MSFDAIWTSAIRRVDNSVEERVVARCVSRLILTTELSFIHYTNFQVRDEHRQDYDAGRGGWGAQAQRAEMERRRELDARYADAQDGPGAVAGGGEDWKAVHATAEPTSNKRGRSPDDDDTARTVRTEPSCCEIFVTTYSRICVLQRIRGDEQDARM